MIYRLYLHRMNQFINAATMNKNKNSFFMAFFFIISSDVACASCGLLLACIEFFLGLGIILLTGSSKLEIMLDSSKLLLLLLLLLLLYFWINVKRSWRSLLHLLDSSTARTHNNRIGTLEATDCGTSPKRSAFADWHWKNYPGTFLSTSFPAFLPGTVDKPVSAQL